MTTNERPTRSLYKTQAEVIRSDSMWSIDTLADIIVHRGHFPPKKLPNPMSGNKLPDYERPPVVETILGVQFDPMAEFRTAHLGAFWATLGEDWPITDEVPSLEPQFEKFDESSQWDEFGFRLKLSSQPQSRLRIRNRTNDRMIQVQNGRFILNWLRIEGRTYPRYERIREDFSDYLQCFRKYLTGAAKLALPKANQWEITYINHIPRATVWHTPGDWDFFRPLRSAAAVQSDVPITLESFSGEWHHVISPQKGRLHVSWQHGQRSEVEVVVLNLTARGPCNADALNPLAITEGLNVGHDAIVGSFRDLMSDEANQFWGLKPQ